MDTVNVNYNESGIVCFMNKSGGKSTEDNFTTEINGGLSGTPESHYIDELNGGESDSQYFPYDCESAPVEVVPMS
jgi:hypothetical protein